MFQFNLLPTQYQKITRRWIILQHITNGLGLLNLTLLIISGMIYLGIYSLNTIITEAQTKRSNVTSSSTLPPEVAAKIQMTNQTISGLRLIQQQHYNYLSLVESISNTIGEDLYMQGISIVYSDKKITLSGTAADRTALQKIQKAIEKDTRFQITAFPFDVFTQRENIPFTIELQFTPEDFTYSL